MTVSIQPVPESRRSFAAQHSSKRAQSRHAAVQQMAPFAAKTPVAPGPLLPLTQGDGRCGAARKSRHSPRVQILTKG